MDHKKVFGRTVGIILVDIEGKSRLGLDSSYLLNINKYYNGKIDLYYKLVTVRVFRVKIVRFMSIVLIYSGLYRIIFHEFVRVDNLRIGST